MCGGRSGEVIYKSFASEAYGARRVAPASPRCGVRRSGSKSDESRRVVDMEVCLRWIVLGRGVVALVEGCVLLPWSGALKSPSDSGNPRPHDPSSTTQPFPFLFHPSTMASHGINRHRYVPGMPALPRNGVVELAIRLHCPTRGIDHEWTLLGLKKDH